jgi:sugar fermentation stimulation protein A
VELKSATLVVKGRAIFPDAPTERGRRHLQSLMQAKRGGHGAAAFFAVQRSDATSFAPNDETDPEFGRALRRAQKAGVQVYAYTCRVSTREIALDRSIPVRL